MRTNIHPLSTGRFHLLTALLAALLLTGCAGSSHVGESWQCPIAQGTACASVSEADPAAAPPGKPGEPVPAALPRPTETTGTSFLGGFIAWFAELFRLDEEDDGEVATAEPLFAMPEAEPPDPADETLRTKERVARIWIAPYVDSSGVYREGGWVRAVIAPARWRLP